MKKDKNPNNKSSSPNGRQSKSKDPLSYPHFQDEDYIVFCFTQDGVLEIAQESPRPIKPKGEKKETTEDANGRSYQFQENNSGESMDSDQSESSSESFSFPVLQWELMGSPDLMPKSQGRDSRKHKVSCARFQCCRF